MLESLVRLKAESIPGLVTYAPGFADPSGYLSSKGWGILAGLVSSAICLTMYKASRYLTPLFFRQSYGALSREDKRNWDSRYSSNIHSALCVYFAYELLYKSNFFWQDGPVPMILRTSPSTYLALGVSFGYFVIDFWTCVKYNLGGTEMVLHHLGSLLSVTTALVTGDGHMHTLWMLVTEFTTPLINNRWWLDKMGLRAHKLYVVNGLSILVSWIFARLLVFPPFFWIVWQTRDQVTEIVPLSKFLLLVVPIILTFLNLFWFYKIVKGAMKILTVPADKKTSKAE